jgi:hypothetical protein
LECGWEQSSFSRLLSVAPLGSLFTDPKFILLNKIVALVAAALSMVLSIFDPKDALSKVEETEERYSILLNKFEWLWNEILVGLHEDSIAERLSVLIDEMAQIKEPNVRTSNRLKNQSYSEICAAGGILVDAWETFQSRSKAATSKGRHEDSASEALAAAGGSAAGGSAARTKAEAERVNVRQAIPQDTPLAG